MKKYYQQLKKIHDFHSLEKNELKDYIHLQKTEVSNLLSIPPEFWVIIDYVIHLTRAVLKKPKIEAEKDLKSVIKPLFDCYNSKIERILRKMPENEFLYLKQDMKSFHHIICHSVNLIDKGLPHFIPSYLFIDSIEKMTVLYPLHENCCDHGTLARGNYHVLMSRYISESFTPGIRDIINFLIWLQNILPHAVTDDRVYLRNRMISIMEEFISNEHQFKNAEDYSTKELVIELREVITVSYIRENIISLLEKIKSPASQIPVSECLDHIASIFIETGKLSPERTTARDLAIATEMCGKIIEGIKNESEKKVLYENLVLANALKPYFLKVTRYMLDPKTDLELCRLIEICDFLFVTYPSVRATDELLELLENIHKSLETERELVCSTNSVTIDPEAMNLFKSKMKQVSARN